jgi:putative nucleotidyltransferase with HDIG domain
MATVDLDSYINRVKHLPPAPQLLPELLDLLGQPNIDSSRVVRVITYDPALTASVLQLCNNAFLGSSTPVVNLEEAVLRLGFEQVYRLVAPVSGARTFASNGNGAARDRGELWNHSVTTAVAAQMIALDLGDDRNLVFTAALLHDIGKIILAEALADTYTNLVREVEANQYSLAEAEKTVLGVEHSAIGGRLMARWKFPLNLVSGVWFHHHPAAAQPHHRLAACVYLGNLIAYLMGYGCGHQAIALHRRAEALEILNLNGDCLPRYMLATYAEFKAIQALLQVGV